MLAVPHAAPMDHAPSTPECSGKMLVGGAEGVGDLAMSEYARELLLKPLGFRATSLVRYAKSSRSHSEGAAAAAMAAIESTAASAGPSEADVAMPPEQDMCGVPTTAQAAQARAPGMVLYRHAISLLADAL